MLIKLQEGRKSRNYQIIENARDVRYGLLPERSADDLAFKGLFERPNSSIFYLITEDDIMVGAGFPRDAVHLELNNISFTVDGEMRSTWFDGEAFICTDEGKTVQRIHPAGFAFIEKDDSGNDIILSEDDIERIRKAA